MPSITHEIKEGGEFPPEKGRYVLYAGLFCPFATRATIARSLKGLGDDILPLVITNSAMDPDRRSWTFKEQAIAGRPELGVAGTHPEPFEKAQDLRELYERSEGSDVGGPYVVPTLWDTKTKRIVNNESLSILRMLSTAFNSLLPADKAAVNLYPAERSAEIDSLYEASARDVFGGVYKAGFATDQAAYETALEGVYTGLDRLEDVLKKSGGPYLLGKELTEIDVSTYTSLIRFDVAYVYVFKCNWATIRGDYPLLHDWLRRLYWNNESFRASTDFEHIKSNYYSGSSRADQVNPTRVKARGPKHPILPLKL